MDKKIGPKLFGPKAYPAQIFSTRAYPATCVSSELLRACFLQGGHFIFLIFFFKVVISFFSFNLFFKVVISFFLLFFLNLFFKVVRDEAKDAERKSKRRAEAERRRDESAKSLFDFINVKLRGGAGINIDPNHGKRRSKNGFSNNKQTEKVPVNEESSKNLKIRQFELGERITKVEREISKYKESHARLKAKDPKSAATVQAKLEAKVVELKRLQQKEVKLKQEEGSRNAKSKLAIF